jgi:hypothetical protein
MRTTLDIEDDVLAAAKELARRERRSAGAVISELARRSVTGAAALVDAGRASRSAARAGVAGFRPFPARGKVVTNELIDALRDAEGV